MHFADIPTLYCLGFSCDIQHLRNSKNQAEAMLIVNEVVDGLLQVFSER
jgi:predicted CDP-diglyceride synthetase/phosphatidate cytidylyltransferase